jgi:hypothetical protein
MGRSRKPATAAILALIILAALSGCAAKSLPPVQVSDLKGILQEIWRQSQPDKAFEAIASVRIESPEGTYSTRAALIALEPGFLRLETIPLFGTPDFLITINERNMKAFYIRQGKFYIGPAEKGISLFAPLGLTPAEIVSVLKGSIPKYALAPGISVKGSRENGKYRLDLFSSKGLTRSLWVDSTSGRLTRMDIPGTHNDIYTVDFDNFKEVEGSQFPGFIELKSPDGRTVQIRFTTISVSAGPGKDAFDLDVPAGLEPIILPDR